MPKPIIIFFLFLSILILLILTSCGVESDKESSLPTNAKVVEHLGNGWVIFESNDMTFMYHRRFDGYRGIESITRID